LFPGRPREYTEVVGDLKSTVFAGVFCVAGGFCADFRPRTGLGSSTGLKSSRLETAPRDFDEDSRIKGVDWIGAGDMFGSGSSSEGILLIISSRSEYISSSSDSSWISERSRWLEEIFPGLILEELVDW